MPPTTSPLPAARLAARLRAVLIAARPGWRGRALYALASLPLGALYLALYLGLIGSVVALVYGVGVLLILLVLAVTRGLAGMERRLARRLLGVDVPEGERVRDQRSVVRKLRRLVLAPDTWRALGWLGARLLFGVATSAAVLFGAALFVVLGWDVGWNPLNALPLLALMALDVVLTLAVVDLLVRLSASVAPRLLGTAPEQRIAALQQSTRRLADRNKLARDLHDTIGHALTASLLQATAARRTLTPADDRPLQPDFARQALGHIETNTRTALAELDRVLTVLRAEDGGRDPVPFAAPSLDDLEDLLAGLRDGGLPVELVVDGDVDDVPAGVQELAYRVVQEGTTNVLRHAGTPLTVAQVARSGDTLVVRVCNEPVAQQDGRPGPGGGRGLAGLRERATAAGGTLTAERTPSGGFDLCVTLPLSGAA
ncbi:sensor histidine kinase [Modestobacter sp. VKM Ac-2978]|uniref:sensor histidine kinase n=1 Tax=Modestobacter sp. VKM Ac-2978 TaxID=3004132 RepID=UPI0022AAAEFD|nr:sensor domain-containing protein [Modestobacter sp. VKM Ac-2978]MCZ2848610.1 sensor domain-containing protein [Modestobacter sp. VKM Ac-2978]